LGALIFGFLDGVLRVEGKMPPPQEEDKNEGDGTEEQRFGDSANRAG
jgi:hypothetical protein